MKTYVFRAEIRRPCVIAVEAASFAEALKLASEHDYEAIDEESSCYELEVFDDGEEESLQFATDRGFNEEA